MVPERAPFILAAVTDRRRGCAEFTPPHVFAQLAANSGSAIIDFVETQFEFDYDFNCDGRHGVPESNNPYIRHHREGGVELAVMMLQHYFTYGDDLHGSLLRDSVLPWARSLITWYREHYPAHPNSSTLFLQGAQACETYPSCDDPADVVSGLHRFGQLLVSLPSSEHVSPADRESFGAFLASLPGIPLGYRRTPFDGPLQVVPCAPGFPFRHVNSENTETYALWPYEFFSVNRTESLHGRYPLNVGRTTYARRLWPGNHAWNYDGADAAVLGLAQELWTMLSERVFSQGTCQGSRFPGYVPQTHENVQHTAYHERHIRL